MPGLLDIAPSMRTVKVGNVDVSVTALSAKGIAVLLHRFPEIRMILSGREPDLSPDALIQLVPEAVAAIIAVGTGYPGDPDAEAKAAALPVGVQVELLEAIITESMPRGVGPFVETLKAVMGGVAADLGSTPASKSPKPSKS